MSDIDALIARVRATVRLISPDHLTPIGARLIEDVLSDRSAGDPEGLMSDDGP